MTTGEIIFWIAMILVTAWFWSGYAIKIFKRK